MDFEETITFNSFEEFQAFLRNTSLPIDFFNMTSDYPFNLTSDLTSPTLDVNGSITSATAAPSNALVEAKYIMTKELSEDIQGVLQCYIFPIITLFGLTGNILSLVVLFQRHMRLSTTSIVLIGLALSDTMFLITNAIRKSTGIISLYDELAAKTLNATTFYYMFYLKTAFSRVSTVIVVLISVERLVAVAFPLKIKTIVTKARMTASVVFCYVIVFAGLAALPAQYTFVYMGKTPMIWPTKFALENQDELKIYNEYFLPIAFRHVPVLLVLSINILIIVLLGRSKRFQKSSTKRDTKRSEEQKKITRMLLSVAIVFLICLLPGDVLLICALVIDGFKFRGTYHNLFMALSDICLMFEMLNSCANFVIYMLLNKNFNDTFQKLFCSWTRRLRSLDEESKTSKTSGTNETSLKSKNRFADISGVDDDDSSRASTEVKGQVNQAYVE